MIEKFLFNYYWHVNTISARVEWGKSGFNISITEPDSQDVRSIEDKYTTSRELQNLCLKNPEKVRVGQLNLIYYDH